MSVNCFEQADLENFKARIAEGDVDAMYLLGVKFVSLILVLFGHVCTSLTC
jgi:hypothetical protein